MTLSNGKLVGAFVIRETKLLFFLVADIRICSVRSSVLLCLCAKLFEHRLTEYCESW